MQRLLTWVHPYLERLEQYTEVGLRSFLKSWAWLASGQAVGTASAILLALGYSHPCVLTIPEGITVTVAESTKLTIEGADKHLVGQITATIFNYYPAEPYKGKGVQIVGKYVRRKEGKKSA